MRMAKGLPTETIVFAVSFLLIGAEFVLMGSSDDPAEIHRPVVVAPPAASEEEGPPVGAPQPDFVEQEEIIPETEDDAEAFADEDFDMAFGQPLDSTDPLASAEPEFDAPETTDPFRDDTFDRDYGQPLPPDPILDNFGD